MDFNLEFYYTILSSRWKRRKQFPGKTCVLISEVDFDGQKKLIGKWEKLNWLKRVGQLAGRKKNR